MIKQYKDLTAATAILPHVINAFLAIAKAVSYTLNRKKIWKILSTLNENFPNSKEKQSKYNVEKYLKVFNVFQKVYIAVYVGFFMSFSIDPMIQMIQSGSKKFPADIWLPFDGYQPFVFELVYLFLTVVAISSVSVSISSNLLLFTIVFLTSKEFDILKVDFIELRDFSDMEKRAELRNLVARHQALIAVVGDIENLIAPVFLFSFVQSSILICLTSFQISTATEFIIFFDYGMFFSAMLMKTSFLCFCGQKIINSSSGIADAIYEINWYEAKDVKIKQDLAFVMLRAQNFCKLTAAKFKVISLDIFTTILGSSISYFTLLRSIYFLKQE